MKRYYDVKQCSSREDLEKMGMSRATVYRKANQLGLPRKRTSKPDQYMNCTDDELKELVKKGVLSRMDKSRIKARRKQEEPIDNTVMPESTVENTEKETPMNEKTSQEVITYLLGEVKRLTSELNDAKKRIKDYEGWYDKLLNERMEWENKYHSLTLEISNNSEKTKKSLDPSFSSVVNSV